ncbi:MAG: response regulator [Alphaproteobacteria bacterium]|jgi:DNA-binding response OmpR family regulator|nr:response regulator [Alphaproteobacteria bacterium]
MSGTKTILLIDDDKDMREALAEQFDMHDGFETLQAGTAGAGIDLAVSERIDLILLDIDLPDMDGREACKQMRAKSVSVPIVMLTGQDTDADAILGLDSGANDYVTKPFRFAVLLARVRAQMRSFEQSEDATFQIGPYEFQPSMKVLQSGESRRIRLTEKETNILKYLYRAGGKTVEREELLSEVWGYNANVTTHTLETHVYRLRQKIEADPANARILLTESGGYRLQP